MGQLFLYSDIGNQETALSLVADKVASFFDEDYSAGLLRLGLANFTMPLPPSLSYWQRFAQIFLTEICKLSTYEEKDIVIPRLELDGLLKRAPFMRGADLLDIEMLAALWRNLTRSFFSNLEHFGNNLQAFFQAHNSTWNMVGRVCFHLAENKNNDDKPFAFLATYSTRLLSTSSLQHLPLGRALQEYVGEQNRSQLLALLTPVQKAAEQSGLIKTLVDNGSIFRPLAFGVSEAHQFLKAIPIFEAAGLIVRVPNWWNTKKPPRPQIKIALGKTQTSTMGLNSLLDFDMEFALGDGKKITLGRVLKQR